jgi:hypothetical protein
LVLLIRLALSGWLYQVEMSAKLTRPAKIERTGNIQPEFGD